MLMHIRAQILCLGTWRGILAVGGALQTMRMLAKADALGNHEAREHDQMTTERKEKLARFHPQGGKEQLDVAHQRGLDPWPAPAMHTV